MGGIEDLNDDGVYWDPDLELADEDDHGEYDYVECPCCGDNFIECGCTADTVLECDPDFFGDWE